MSLLKEFTKFRKDNENESKLWRKCIGFQVERDRDRVSLLWNVEMSISQFSVSD
jgi:hypothetical protein